jgi:hypothetical protein
MTSTVIGAPVALAGGFDERVLLSPLSEQGRPE